jgi:hypothetical protein
MTAPTADAGQATAEAERIEKLRRTWPAQAALAGYELRRMADGRWLVSRWNLSKELAEDEVEAWLAQVGARSA